MASSIAGVVVDEWYKWQLLKGKKTKREKNIAGSAPSPAREINLTGWNPFKILVKSGDSTNLGR